MSPHKPRRLGRSKMVVEVLPNRLTKKKLEIELGGHLEITLQGNATPSDRMATLRDRPAMNGHWYSPALWSSRPTIQIQSTDGFHADVTWYPQVGPRDRGVERHWPFGETHRSECLPNGPFVLTARLPGGRTAQAQVTIESGKTTQVTLRFE